MPPSTKIIPRPIALVALGAFLSLVPLASKGHAQATTATYLCINRVNGIRDKIINLNRGNSTVFVREIPGETFSSAAQYGANNTVRWIYYHHGVRVTSGSVTYFLNLATNTLYTLLTAITMFDTKINSNLVWSCRKLQ